MCFILVEFTVVILASAFAFWWCCPDWSFWNSGMPAYPAKTRHIWAGFPPQSLSSLTLAFPRLDLLECQPMYGQVCQPMYGQVFLDDFGHWSSTFASTCHCN
ncbi:hypothetical protein CBR_g41714 [Chara braunii]|uniref:Uncharacterized protein n=1 Tax=Chara braunii TaxID=69332 RepID=A0A388LWR1_CHABU|nr:hypothetical protein CBR_g41714 [Chara braunii]|eukprot:GBG86652.1 hypothetical protein CBR_g41714 [Chara braunii]